MSITIPICRWPATLHHPCVDVPMMPASSSARSPGRSRGVRTSPITKSWDVVESVFVRVTTRRSPRGTVIRAGTKLIVFVATSTRVVPSAVELMVELTATAVMTATA